jgi:hypothetical protein
VLGPSKALLHRPVGPPPARQVIHHNLALQRRLAETENSWADARAASEALRGEVAALSRERAELSRSADKLQARVAELQAAVERTEVGGGAPQPEGEGWGGVSLWGRAGGRPGGA